MPMIDVQGYCPMGCGETLHLNPDSGMIACLSKTCPHPLAVTTLIAKEPPTSHLVEVGTEGWAIEHPLWERVLDQIFDCPLGKWLEDLDGPPVSAGFYRVERRGDSLTLVIGPDNSITIDGWHFEETER